MRTASWAASIEKEKKKLECLATWKQDLRDSAPSPQTFLVASVLFVCITTTCMGHSRLTRTEQGKKRNGLAMCSENIGLANTCRPLLVSLFLVLFTHYGFSPSLVLTSQYPPFPPSFPSADSVFHSPFSAITTFTQR